MLAMRLNALFIAAMLTSCVCVYPLVASLAPTGCHQLMLYTEGFNSNEKELSFGKVLLLINIRRSFTGFYAFKGFTPCPLLVYAIKGTCFMGNTN